jgi:hypothetical protein
MAACDAVIMIVASQIQNAIDHRRQRNSARSVAVNSARICRRPVLDTGQQRYRGWKAIQDKAGLL